MFDDFYLHSRVSCKRKPKIAIYAGYVLSNFYKMTNKMQLSRIIYFSLSAVHVSSDIFAHHQEHLNCSYSFWFYSRASLSAAVMAE